MATIGADSKLLASRFINDSQPTESATGKGLSIPGAVCWAVNASAAIFPPTCVGRRSALPDAEGMTVDTVMFMASTTKLVTSVAAMQCVERGLIGLDEPVGKYLPDLEFDKVIEGWREVEGGGPEEPVTRPAKTQLTLRHMLNHTSGLSAAIFDPVYQKYNDWKGWPQRTPTGPEFMTHPLRFDPGSKWLYGFGIDWAGILVARLNNCTLGEYLQKNIFSPLSMNSTTFRPAASPSTKSRLASVSVRNADGTFKPEPYDMWLNDSIEVPYDAGGYGLYSTPEDYILFLQSFLGDGDGKILTKESIDEMFRPQLPSAQWLKENAEDAKGITISGNIMFPESPVNHGLGFVIADEDLPTGCRAGAAEGGGLTNTYWWIDRKAGVAGLVFLNMLPYMDTEAVKLWIDFQKKVYETVDRK